MAAPIKRYAAACLALAALAMTAAGAAKACSVSQFELTEKAPLPRYTFVLFHRPGTPINVKTLATHKALAKTWAARANVDFEAIDVSTKRGEKVARYWQVKEFPVTFVIAPTGWNLATFKGQLDPKAVEPLMSSPGKVALLEALKKKKAVFLVLGKKKMKGFGDALKAAKKATESVKTAMKIETGTVVVDPTDKQEATLLQNLGLEEPPKEAQVFVTFGKGRAVLQEVDAEDTVERLAFTVQLLATADQCSLGNEIRGEPLLLGK